MDMPSRHQQALQQMVDRLKAALDDRLVSVVLYGSAARGDFTREISDLNLLVVASDLEPSTLERLGPPVAEWVRQRHPFPRLFSPAMLAASADVFPIEFHELLQRHVVLAGSDPFTGLEVHHDYLRLQCERELREKLMRLTEGYVEASRRDRDVLRLMAESYSAFAAIFRGCLQLLGAEPPMAAHDVVAHFCSRAGLDPAPFDSVECIRRGERPDGTTAELFARYYGEIAKAVERIDRFSPTS
jgi:hypothetical protein